MILEGSVEGVSFEMCYVCMIHMCYTWLDSVLKQNMACAVSCVSLW